MKTHAPVVAVLGRAVIDQSGTTANVYAKECSSCGRKVRRMTGLGGTFQHSGNGRPKGQVNSPEHRANIAAGMRRANERRRLSYGRAR